MLIAKRRTTVEGRLSVVRLRRACLPTQTLFRPSCPSCTACGGGRRGSTVARRANEQNPRSSAPLGDRSKPLHIRLHRYNSAGHIAAHVRTVTDSSKAPRSERVFSLETELCFRPPEPHPRKPPARSNRGPAAESRPACPFPSCRFRAPSREFARA